ncbi:MAG: hypothetical protein ACREAX_01920 [Candidatus Nitrosotenuis sp.]
MAKIRLRFGENEIEIESRDFYIDNDTAAQVIADLAVRLQESEARIVTGEVSLEPPTGIMNAYKINVDYLRTLRDAEVHEPEFTAPAPVSADEVPSKIEFLEKDSFFDKPRTVSETVERMRDCGWLASPLDVSKSLAKMAFHKELAKNSQENRTWYFKNAQMIN